MALTPARMATPLVVKGIGIPILKQYGIMDKLQAAVENKKSINTRQGSLFAVRFSQCQPSACVCHAWSLTLLRSRHNAV